MSLSPKIILHCPIENPALLPAFVEQCLKDKVSLLAIVGQGAAELEEEIDWLVVGDGSDHDRFLCTASDPGDALDDIRNMAETWERELGGSVEEITL